MKFKKAQIAIFILLVFVLLIGVGFIFYLRNIDNSDVEIKKVSESSLRLGPIQTYVDTCIKIIGLDGIYFISSRGGYFNLPDNFFNAKPATAFYVYNNDDISPSINTIENELSQYVKEQIVYCLDKLDLPGRKIIFGEKKIQTIIRNESIIISLSMPTEITSLDSRLSINDYRITINDDKLSKAIDVAKYISNEISNNPQYLCLTCIFKKANQNNFDVLIEPYNDNTYIIQLIESSDEESEYVFNFVIHVTENEI